MISIRLWREIPTPSGERMKRLPVLPGELVVPGIGQIVSVLIEQINVHGQTNQMKTMRNSDSGGSIRFRLSGATDDLADGDFVSVTVEIVQQPGEQSGKQFPLLP